MLVELVIPGRFPSLNDYVAAERSNRFKASTMKRTETDRVAWEARARRLPTFEKPVEISFKWIEKDTRRDVDNVAFAKKFILDGLVLAGVLKGDSRKYVTGIHDDFSEIDSTNPRVEITIEEVSNGA